MKLGFYQISQQYQDEGYLRESRYLHTALTIRYKMKQKQNDISVTRSKSSPFIGKQMVVSPSQRIENSGLTTICLPMKE